MDRLNNIRPSTNETLTEEQEYYLEYEQLLVNNFLREIEADEALSKFLNLAQRDIKEFQENYPEIDSE